MATTWNGLSVTSHSTGYQYGNGVEKSISAVDRFSKKRILRRLKVATDVTLSLNEIIKQGLYDDLDFYGVVHPIKNNKFLKTDVSGDFIEGKIKCHYNPFNGLNLVINPNGNYLRLGDYEGNQSHADLLFYNNQWWKVTADNLYEVQDEKSTDKSELRIAEFSLLTQDSEPLTGFVSETLLNTDTAFN